MKARRRGVTLIEVLLAMIILSIAIMGLAAVFLSGLKMAHASANLTAATNLGRELLETVKERGYSGTAPGVFDGRVPTPSDAGSDFPPTPYPQSTVDQHQYTLVVRCQDHSPTLRAVEVDVYWDRDSKATFSTMVHQ